MTASPLGSSLTLSARDRDVNPMGGGPHNACAWPPSGETLAVNGSPQRQALFVGAGTGLLTGQPRPTKDYEEVVRRLSVMALGQVKLESDVAELKELVIKLTDG